VLVKLIVPTVVFAYIELIYIDVYIKIYVNDLHHWV